MANERKNDRDSSGTARDSDRPNNDGNKGSQQSQQGSKDSGTSQSGGADKSGGQQRGGSGNFTNDPQRASETGRKGGDHSHG